MSLMCQTDREKMVLPDNNKNKANEQWRLDIRWFFSQTTVNEWNRLSANVGASSVNILAN